MRVAELPWRLFLIIGIPDASVQSIVTSDSCHSQLTLRESVKERYTERKNCTDGNSKWKTLDSIVSKLSFRLDG